MTRFTAQHRAGSGPPLVCLHGFADTWRTWELVLPALERRHDVLALTLPGHAGGPPLPAEISDAGIVGVVEAAMDAAGFATAHVVGNSLGGYVALRLAARGRARSVVALAPAGGWARGGRAYSELLRLQAGLLDQVKAAAPHAEAIVSTPQGRRLVTQYLTVNFEHIPADLLAHQLRGAADCPGALPLLEHAAGYGWELEAERIACPVRIVWGAADRLLPWPAAATRFRAEWLPHADWVVLEDVGHCPQLDVPLVTAELIRGFA